MNDTTFAGPNSVSVATISRGCFDFGSELGDLFDRRVTFVRALEKELLAEDCAVRSGLPARDATGPTASCTPFAAPDSGACTSGSLGGPAFGYKCEVRWSSS